MTFPIARDPDESVRRAYNVLPLPTTILINKDGIIEDIITRGMSEDEIRSLMESIQPELRSLFKMSKIKCQCGHENPFGTVLCERCGRPQTEEAKNSETVDMRYEGSARRSQTYKRINYR